MTKNLKGLAEYYQDNNGVDSALETKIIETIKAEIEKIDRETFIKKRKISLWAGITFIIIMLVATPLFAVVIGASHVVAACFVPFLCAICCFIYRSRVNGQYEKIVRKSIDQKLIYKTYFENKYSNFEVRNAVVIDPRLASSYRGKEIPNDATISSQIPGFTFVIDKVQVDASVVVWKWRRSFGRGSQTYTRRVLYFDSNTFDPRWKDFELSLLPSVGWFKKEEDLENEEFNKKFTYKTNDQVRLRVLLTPFVQESFANNISKVPGGKTWAFNFDKNYWITSKVTTSTIFEVNRIALNKDINVIAKNIFMDFREDLSYVEMQLATIWTMRELVKIR